jgi:hypothetical protein
MFHLYVWGMGARSNLADAVLLSSGAPTCGAARHDGVRRGDHAFRRQSNKNNDEDGPLDDGEWRGQPRNELDRVTKVMFDKSVPKTPGRRHSPWTADNLTRRGSSTWGGSEVEAIQGPHGGVCPTSG